MVAVKPAFNQFLNTSPSVTRAFCQCMQDANTTGGRMLFCLNRRITIDTWRVGGPAPKHSCFSENHQIKPDIAFYHASFIQQELSPKECKLGSLV